MRFQAGVTIYPFGELLYAFDEVSPALSLDPETLQALSEQTLGDPTKEFMIKAHTKFDPLTGMAAVRRDARAIELRLAGAAFAYLCARYPACFNQATPQPLKVGIDQDIAAEAAPEVPRFDQGRARALCGGDRVPQGSGRRACASRPSWCTGRDRHGR